MKQCEKKLVRQAERQIRPSAKSSSLRTIFVTGNFENSKQSVFLDVKQNSFVLPVDSAFWLLLDQQNQKN